MNSPVNDFQVHTLLLKKDSAVRRFLNIRDWIIFVFCFLFCGFFFSVSFGQIPPGYYDPAAGLGGEQLKAALHNIIKDHTVLTYDALWDAFVQTDKKPNGKVWDVYSDIPGGTPPYQYTFIEDQCGNYSQEGDCYNREHSFPKSWFGGDVYPMFSDLFHLYPTDGFVNGKRSNYPYGKVNNPSWTSLNGSKLGNNTTSGYSGVVFEPIDAYKGDLARTYFYMATRYYGEDNGWPGSDMVDGAEPLPWALTLLYSWHQQDPVSQKETDRNNAIYLLQENRNPYIDHPEYVGAVWYNTGVNIYELSSTTKFRIFPNPVGHVLNISASQVEQDNDYTFTITDETGQCYLQYKMAASQDYTLDVSGLAKGFYLLSIKEGENANPKVFKLVK